MPLFILLVIGLWFMFGDPPKTLANAFYKNDAAPWETVDAFYYPDRADLTRFQEMPDLSSVKDCRNWVRLVSASNNDGALNLGDYECGIGLVDTLGGIAVYRTTTR